jgi:hypothetical protein
VRTIARTSRRIQDRKFKKTEPRERFAPAMVSDRPTDINKE